MVLINLGIGRADSTKKHGERTKRTLDLKNDEANHITLLGKSGYGKTTIMRGMIEEIYSSYSDAGIPPIIIVIERKVDTSKPKKVIEIYHEESEKLSSAQLSRKYGEGIWNYIEHYVNELENDKELKYGLMGDFSIGFPNILGKYTKMESDEYKSLLGRHGLSPAAYPARRFVFRPRRNIENIAFDNGPLTEPVDSKLAYPDIPFEIIADMNNLGEQTRYFAVLKNIWDIQKIREPDQVLRIAGNYEAGNSGPSQTYLRIEETMNRLRSDSLFSGESKDSFLKQITNKKINILDFSQNSELDSFEECLIFKLVVQHAINVAIKYRIPVFFVADEVQNFMRDPAGKWAIDKILREGRSLCINLICATQYTDNLPKDVLIGSSHIGIMGKLASNTDTKTLEKLIPDFKDVVDFDEPGSLSEYESLKRKLRFRGYFSYNKDYTEHIEYRQPQSL
ncbi:ATP-binding protein [Methanococcus maripaludis]|uniref:Type IV secretory pathway VirB4 component n=1 Tax=Methanococcus maripaludis TaxID=39152 RepID=A0A7J9PNS8_METMI|nr:ATP-binding protein [Methanococcus maripaludis]MBA2864902.1 type IV secretory pathway VirB4 component [Methanococcus maripaludis]